MPCCWLPQVLVCVHHEVGAFSQAIAVCFYSGQTIGHGKWVWSCSGLVVVLLGGLTQVRQKAVGESALSVVGITRDNTVQMVRWAGLQPGSDMGWPLQTLYDCIRDVLLQGWLDAPSEDRGLDQCWGCLYRWHHCAWEWELACMHTAGKEDTFLCSMCLSLYCCFCWENIKVLVQVFTSIINWSGICHWVFFRSILSVIPYPITNMQVIRFLCNKAAY